MNRKYDNQIIEGINIIDNYIPASEDFNLAAEHDQIWFGTYEMVDGKEDIKRLEELGWFENEDSWSTFV